MFTIHPITDKDLPELAGLYGQLTGTKPDLTLLAERLGEVRQEPLYTLFGVYDDEDRLIATASLTRCFDLTDDCRPYYNMENFVVDEACRRKGAGAFLLRAVEDFARAQGGRYINFTSAPSRTGAHRFYEAMGYRMDATRGFKKVL